MTRSLSNCCNLTSVIGSSSSFCPPVAYYDLQGLHLGDQKETSHLWQLWTGSRTWNNVIAKCTGYLEKMSLKSISSSRANLYQPLWTALKFTLLMCTSKIHLSISLKGTHLYHGFVSEWILGRTRYHQWPEITFANQHISNYWLLSPPTIVDQQPITISFIAIIYHSPALTSTDYHHAYQRHQNHPI